MEPLRRPDVGREPPRFADEEPEANGTFFFLQQRRLIRDREQVLERRLVGQDGVARIARPRIRERLELAPARASEFGHPGGVRVQGAAFSNRARGSRS